MNNKIIFSFIAGAAIGSVATYFVVKDRFEKIVKTEIDSVKETFSRLRKEELTAEAKKYEELTDKYTKNVKNVQYVCDSVDILDESEEDHNTIEGFKPDEPYVISPNEFDEFDDYETVSLTYYADGVLADDEDEIVDDVEEAIGLDSLEHFGEYEPDSVFIRNDRRKCDYEILLDERRYSDVVGKHPHLNDV